MKGLVIIAIGPSGSGKSTLYQKLMKIYGDKIAKISFDDWRVEEYLKYHPEDKDLPYNELYQKAFQWYLKHKDQLNQLFLERSEKIISQYPIVYVDNTNLKIKYRKAFIDLGHRYGKLVVGLVFSIDLNELIKRDQERSSYEKSVGSEVIKKQVESYEEPSLREGFDIIMNQKLVNEVLQSYTKEV